MNKWIRERGLPNLITYLADTKTVFPFAVLQLLLDEGVVLLLYFK